MIYDVNKLTSSYQLPPSAGLSGAFGTYPESGTSYVERRQLEGTAVAPVSLCAFGSVYQDDEGDWYLLGGTLFCGDKNFYVEDQFVNAQTDGEFLVSIKLSGIRANTDDDDEIILPGVKTSTGTPAWHNKVYSEGTSYDSNTNFAGPTSTGQIVVPIGRMTIANDAVSLAFASCGNITVTQCAGILSHSRG